MINSDEKGFTLVELMLVGSIISILALGFASFMINISKQQKTVEVKNNMSSLRMQMDAAATDPGAVINSSNR